MRLELPSGGWAEIKDADTIKRKDRDKIVRGGKDSDELEALNAAIIQLVSGWSFGPEVTVELLDELSIADTNALEAAVVETLDALAPNFEPSPDPKAPTAN